MSLPSEVREDWSSVVATDQHPHTGIRWRWRDLTLETSKAPIEREAIDVDDDGGAAVGPGACRAMIALVVNGFLKASSLRLRVEGV